MRRSGSLLGFVAAVFLGRTACIPSTTKESSSRRIGERCDTAEECAAIGAVCEAQGDPLPRCWKTGCLVDTECGPGGRCLIPEGQDTGTCYLPCEGISDCPAPGSGSEWVCTSVPGAQPGEWYCVLQQKPFCGDGVVQRGEECDDGNYEDGDGCSAECLKETGCGNGRLDVNIDENGVAWVEECDDDNVEDGDGCSSDCRIEGGRAVCGNGILERGELCDPAAPQWQNGGCTEDCTRTDGCGDGAVDEAAGETCDDGNAVWGDGCNGACQLEFVCGNGICERGAGESCALCPFDCCPNCGDGVLDEAAGETCEDGNNISGDGCSKGCRDEDGVPTCGNGILEVGEECEDGNTEPGDGCAPDCTREFVCGDGVCERANSESCRLCPSDCCPDCGNGVIDTQFGELCDRSNLAGMTCEELGYDGGELACTDWCEFDVSGCTGTGPVCGNDEVEWGEDCDGTDLASLTCQDVGFESGTLRCDANCHYDTSGCTNFVGYLREDFEGATVANWTLSGDWEVGSPSGADEPSGAHSGSSCAGTNVGGSYSNDNTWDGCALVTPPIHLVTAVNPVLTFYQYFHCEAGYDGGTLWVSTDDGATWQHLDNTVLEPDYDEDVDGYPAYSGDHSDLGWYQVTVDLFGYVGKTIRIRFAFSSDGSVTRSGWYVDDVVVTER